MPRTFFFFFLLFSLVREKNTVFYFILRTLLNTDGQNYQRLRKAQEENDNGSRFTGKMVTDVETSPRFGFLNFPHLIGSSPRKRETGEDRWAAKTCVEPSGNGRTIEDGVCDAKK